MEQKAVYETPTVNIEFILVLNMGVETDANRLAEYIVANSTVDIDVDALTDACYTIEEVIVE